jgi:hypothetical protein
MNIKTHVFLFGSWILSETTELPAVPTETKKVTAYLFTEVEGKKWFERKEVSERYFLRVKTSFPKDALEPYSEVIAFRKDGTSITYNTETTVLRSKRTGFSHKAVIPVGEVYFNL